MVQLQESISKHLHHHTLSNMRFDRIFETHCARILLCSGPGVNTWLTIWLISPTFQLPSPIFSTTLRTWLGLPHPSIIGISQYVCTHPTDPIDIHFLLCAHSSEHIGTHDAIHNTFATIAWDVGFHLGWKHIHALPSTTFNSSRWWINIVLTKDDIRTLANIVIVDPTWADVFPWSYAIQGFATFNATQAKEKSYHNQHPTNQFLLLTIEVFGCLHKHASVFLHDCANAIWSLKGSKGPHLSIFVTFLHQKVLITLQRMQASSILSRAIVVSLTISQLPPLQNTPPITTTNLLQAVGFWHVNIANLPHVVGYGHEKIFTPTLS